MNELKWTNWMELGDESNGISIGWWIELIEVNKLNGIEWMNWMELGDEMN